MVSKNKRVTVNKKLLNNIESILREHLSLASKNLDVFASYNVELDFNKTPEFWSDTEDALCEYTAELQTKIMDDIEKYLKDGKQLDF